MSSDELLRLQGNTEPDPRYAKKVLKACQCAGRTIIEAIDNQTPMETVINQLGQGIQGRLSDGRHAAGFTCGLCDYPVFGVASTESGITEGLIMSALAESFCIENVKTYGFETHYL